MPTETGRVVAVEADGLWVETIRRSTCGSCAAQKGCGHAMLDRRSNGRRGHIRVIPATREIPQYRVDDQVLIGIPAEIILRGSFIAYGLPLIGMLAGALAAVGWLPGNGDLLAVCGASIGLLLGFSLVGLHGARHRRDAAFQPVVLGLAPPRAEPVTLS